MPEKDVLLKVENLKMYFPAAKSLLGKTTSYVKAVDDVSFEVEKGKTFRLWKDNDRKMYSANYEPDRGPYLL